MLHVLCVDDNLSLNALLCLSIDSESDMKSVGSLDSADALVEQALKLQPDVVVLDLQMPGKDPLEALKELSRECPSVRTVVYSAESPGHALFDLAVEAGAWGCVGKDCNPDAIIAAVRAVAAGRFYLPNGQGREGVER